MTDAFNERVVIKKDGWHSLATPAGRREAELLTKAMESKKSEGSSISFTITDQHIEADTSNAVAVADLLRRSGLNREDQTEWHIELGPELAALPPRLN